MTVRILGGHVLDKLAEIAPNSVQVCVTSPPFFNLRDYKTPPQTWPDGWVGELGQEDTVSRYLDHLLMVFDAVRKVLRLDGTLFVNLGDSYANGGVSGPQGKNGQRASRTFTAAGAGGRVPDGMKPKDLMLIPHRFAIRMQDAGWWVRNDLVWAKTACMPESVQDRATRSHEYIFHFAKNAKYFYDADAVRETWADDRAGASGAKSLVYSEGSGRRDTLGFGDRRGLGIAPGADGRNQRTVWTIGPEPLQEAHFASWPTEIPRRCILAGSSERGECANCGKAWVRVMERVASRPGVTGGAEWSGVLEQISKGGPSRGGGFGGGSTETTGWSPSCACDAGDPVPQTILDPFIGSGRTGIVADRLGRDCIGIELSPQNVAMSERLIRGDSPMFAMVEVE